MKQLFRRTFASREVIFWLGLLFLYAVLFGPNLQSHVARALRPEFVNDDVRQQIFPFFRFEDSLLFRGDYVSDYYFDIIPILYRGLYIVAAWMKASVTLSKLLPYALLAVVVVAMAIAAYRLSGKAAAATAGALVLGHAFYLQRLSGGLPRSFAFPVVALLIWTLATGQVYALVILTCVAAGFYPVVALISGCCLAVWLLLLPASARGNAKDWSWKRRAFVLFATMCGAGLVLLPQSLASRKYGGLIAVTRLREFPEIGPGGRYTSEDRAPFRALDDALRNTLDRSLFSSSEPWVEGFRDWVLEQSGWTVKGITEGIVLFAFAVGLVACLRNDGVRRLLILPICVILGYLGSSQVAPHLFLPQRYIVYTVPLLVVLYVSIAPGLVVNWFPRFGEALRLSVSGVLCAALLLLVGGRGTTRDGLGTTLHPNEPLMEAIERLPKDALIAIWPNGIANDVPYVARRRIFVSNETHQAFHTKYTLEMRRRVRALIDAYSATTEEPLLRLRNEFGVTHLVVQREFVGNKVPRYFKPFDFDIERARRRLGGAVPISQKLTNSTAIFHHGNVAILSLAEVGKGN